MRPSRSPLPTIKFASTWRLAYRVSVLVPLAVVDDGIGFNIADINGKGIENSGFGLASIRERIGELGGRLDFSSSPGQGTTVSVVIPAERNPV